MVNLSYSAQVVSDSLLRRLQATNLRVIFFSLGLLDITMDRCSTPFHKQIAGQAFMKQLITMLNNPKMNKEVRKSEHALLFALYLNFKHD